MKRSDQLHLRPILDPFEPRILLSSAASHTQRYTQAPSNSTIPFPNLLLTPQGVPTAAESRRETYHASFVGQYTLGPGRFSTEISNFYIAGVGRSTVDLHSDCQLRIIRPTDPGVAPAGEISIFTRNLDSNTQIGFDVVANSLDSLGRPTKLTIYALDVNVSSGIYVEGLSQGTITIHYGPTPPTPHFAPSSRRLPGVLSQGTATIIINAQLYGIGTTFNLRNVDYNP
jgi:hypothetical protein